MASVGIIVGAVCGSVLFIATLGVLYYYFWPRNAVRMRGESDDIEANEGFDNSSQRGLDPMPVLLGPSSGEQQQRRIASKKRKMDYVVDAILGKVYPKEKEVATVTTCGIHVVDHHFVLGAMDRHDR